MNDTLLYFYSQQFYILIFCISILIEYIGSKFENKIFDVTASALVFVMSTVVVSQRYIPGRGNVFMYYFVLTFALISVIYILRFVKLTILDYSFLFSVIILYEHFSGIFNSFFGRTMYVCTIFFSILYVFKLRLKNLKGNIFNIWFIFIMTVIGGYFFELIFDYIVRGISYSFDSSIAKIIVWGISAAILVVVNLAVIYGMKKVFNKYFYEINEMGKKYPSIEKYFIYISMGILFMILLMHFGYVLRYGYDYQVSQLLTMFCMFALFIQLLYLTLLFRVTYLKDNLYDKELENQSLALYSSHLEKNIDGIKDIKHDIKNIFFTMSQYVEESGNEEMKLFYHTKIYPFAADEISKNDLYGKLMIINNEQLKAFLYYKISQALGRNINTEFEIDLTRENFTVGIDFTDLVRILGILIDNAIEECVSIADSIINIKISQNNELASYIIKNTVENAKKDKGIKMGVSTKGENRGNGLAIVQNTIEKYDFVMLNSYFKDDLFIQNLNIYLENQ